MGSENSSRTNILGFAFDRLDYRQAFENILDWPQTGPCRLVSLVNPYSVLLGHADEQMARAIQASSLVLPDGVGIIWAARILGDFGISRVTGPELMLRMCDWSRQSGLRHYFYGSTEEVCETLIEHLTDRFPGLQIAGWESPPFHVLSEKENEQAAGRINASRPDVVWVGLGAPKQEKWMLENRSRIHAAALIGVGAAFDFHSRNKPWAPEWMRRWGVEWMHRLVMEPRRMWRRNAASFVFLAKVLAQRLGMQPTPYHHPEPVNDWFGELWTQEPVLDGERSLEESSKETVNS